MEHLTSLIDEYTTYFKSNIEGLPSLERKIFVTLANIWEPATAARVAREARIDVSKVSSFLKRLESRGSVAVVKETGRKKSYQVIERLYNIYHLMRLSGKKSDRVRAVVDFMINFYEGEELAKKIAQLTTEACCLEPEDRKDHLIAYEEILHTVEKDEDREKIIQSTNPEFYTLRDASESLGGAVRDHQLVWETPENGAGNGSTGNAKEITLESLRRDLSANPGKALSVAADFLKNPETGKKYSYIIISFFIDAAAAGHAGEGLELLKNSPCASYVEPLIVGLQMLTGEEYNAPQEVVEVAKDVVKRIEEKKAEDGGKRTKDRKRRKAGNNEGPAANPN